MVEKFMKRAPWMALAAILCILFLTWIRQSRTGEEADRAQFQADIARVEKAIGARLRDYDDILRGANEFIAAQRLDQELWRRYVGSLHLDQKFPMLAALGYAEYISADDLSPRM